jgi:ferredoxin-like protein FixX
MQTNRPDLAQENLVKLVKLCPDSCYELQQLEEYISSTAKK